MKNFHLSTFLLGALGANLAYAAPGALDPSFAFGGLEIVSGAITDTDIDVPSGDVYTISNSPQMVRRYNSRGNLLSQAPVPGPGGPSRMVLIPGRGSPSVAVVGPDRIQILNSFGVVSASYSHAFSSQSTFDVKYDEANKRLVLLQDARVVAIRLDSGLVDTRYAVGGVYQTSPQMVLSKKFELDRQGRIIFAGVGQFGCAEPYCRSAFMARLTNSGELDNDFGNSGFATHAIHSWNAFFAQEPSGRLTLISDTGFNANAARILSVAQFSSDGFDQSPRALVRIPAGVDLRDAEVAPTARLCGPLCASKPSTQLVFSGIQNSSLVAVTAPFSFSAVANAAVTSYGNCQPAYNAANVEVDPNFGFYIGGDNVCRTEYGITSRHLFE